MNIVIHCAEHTAEELEFADVDNRCLMTNTVDIYVKPCGCCQEDAEDRINEAAGVNQDD